MFGHFSDHLGKESRARISLRRVGWPNEGRVYTDCSDLKTSNRTAFHHRVEFSRVKQKIDDPAHFRWFDFPQFSEGPPPRRWASGVYLLEDRDPYGISSQSRAFASQANIDASALFTFRRLDF